MIIVAAIAQLVTQLIANMTVIALPDISLELSFSAETILWINLIYLMSFVAFSLPFAKIISQYGIKKCTKVSLLLLFASVLISFFAFSEYMLLLSRLLQGLSSAALAISIYVMIVNEFEEKELGSALGIVASSGFVGMLIAPSFMGFMIYVADWRAAFLIMIPFVAISLFLLRRINKEWVTEKKPIDNIGSLIYILMMASFAYGITELDQMGIVFVAISIILLIIFIKFEKVFEEPILNTKIFRNLRFTIGNYAAMVTYFTTTIAITALSFHLQYILDMEEYLVSLVLIIAPIIMIGMSNVAGKLANRFDPRLISSVALLSIFVSMIMYAFVDRLPFLLILVAFGLQGLGNGMFSAPNNKFVLTIVEAEELTDASSILSTSKEFGKILSSGIYALIFSIFIGNQALGPESLDASLIQSSNYMMIICAVLAFSAIILLLYSKYKYEYEINEEIIKIFKSITPERIKKIFGDDE
ncbi:MFS transporter [Methanobrevibacter sp.]|uniref:MFS transporter n=1 Tax=Methanobrevibacter sp. TaxID=66852 RepID=UPI00388F21D8